MHVHDLLYHKSLLFLKFAQISFVAEDLNNLRKQGIHEEYLYVACGVNISANAFWYFISNKVATEREALGLQGKYSLLEARWFKLNYYTIGSSISDRFFILRYYVVC